MWASPPKPDAWNSICSSLSRQPQTGRPSFDADDKPVAGVFVNLNGEGQPNGNVRTDREGRFHFDHVCEGRAQLFANDQNSYGNISTEGGDTNVVLRLGQTLNISRVPRRAN